MYLSPNYPDPAIASLDKRFDKYMIFSAGVERLATGGRWSEGPVWFGDGRYLLWSDTAENAIMRWDETTGIASPWRKPSNHSNGNTRDRQGRLVTCEHLTRRITRTEHDGTITVLMDRYEGKRLNSPNDIVVKSDGTIWFSDPTFGIRGNYEGDKAESELPTNLYRYDPARNIATIMSAEIDMPNGLAFSPDERVLYVVESGARPRRIRAFDVAEDGTLSRDRIFVQCEEGQSPDGFRVDTDGNVWGGWGTGPDLDGVVCWAPDGTPIGRIHLPERCANVCFGGVKRNRLFMAASRSIYAVYLNTQGVKGG